MRTKTKVILGATGVALAGLTAAGAYARKVLSARKAKRASVSYGEALGIAINVPECSRDPDSRYTTESIQSIGPRSQALLYRDDRVDIVGTYEGYNVIFWTRCLGSREAHYFYLVDAATLQSIIDFLSTGKIA